MGGKASRESTTAKGIRHAGGLTAAIGHPTISLDSQIQRDPAESLQRRDTREVAIQAEEGQEDGPLFEGIRNADAATLRSLLRKKADPNQVSKTGLTPLHMAMLVGDQETILALLGADNLRIDATTQRDYRRRSVVINAGSNSLHILAHRGKHTDEQQMEEIVDLTKVLMCFIDAEQRDCKNHTPGDIARMANTVMLVTALEKMLRIWKQKTAHRLERLKEQKSTEEEPESQLSESEKSQILNNKSDLMGMKLYAIMARLMKNKVFSDSDVAYIAREFEKDKEKAARYIIEDVIARGPYKHVQYLREALIAESQENLADALPTREP